AVVGREAIFDTLFSGAEGRDARRHRHYLRPVHRPYDRRHPIAASGSDRGSRQAVVLGLVRAGLRKTRWKVDLSVASNCARSDVRRGPAISAQQVVQEKRAPTPPAVRTRTAPIIS